MQNDIRKNGQKKVFTIVYSWIDSKHEFKSGDAVAGRAGAIRLNFVSEWPRLDPDYILTVLNFRQISCHSLGPASNLSISTLERSRRQSGDLQIADILIELKHET